MLRIVAAALIGAWVGSLPVARACIGVLLPPSLSQLQLVEVTAPSGATSEVGRWAESGTWTEDVPYQSATLTFSDGTSMHVVLR